MSATATNILHNPNFTIVVSRRSELKPLFKSKYLDRLHCKKSVFFGGLLTGTMTEMVETSAFRRTDSNGEESVTVIEEEALINGSSQLTAAAGLESTLNRLSKWLVAALFGGVLIWRHDGEALWVAMGSVVNAILSVVLKRTINQERPNSATKSDPGMPSSHAQSIFFTITFSVLSVIEWLGVNEISLSISGLALAFGSYLSWLRVSQQLHTISQVAVGAVVGFAFSILWYFSWNAFMLDAFISYPWVRILVVLGAFASCSAFVVYVIRYWLKDERRAL